MSNQELYNDLCKKEDRLAALAGSGASAEKVSELLKDYYKALQAWVLATNSKRQ